MDLQAAVFVAASLNLIAALVGFPVLWDRVSRLTGEVAELRANVRQIELNRRQTDSHPGEESHG